MDFADVPSLTISAFAYIRGKWYTGYFFDVHIYLLFYRIKVQYTRVKKEGLDPGGRIKS